MEVYQLVADHYEKMLPNDRGRYTIAPMGVELGIWQGCYQNVELPWLRWWDEQGNLLLTGDERAEVERQRAEVERQRAEVERQRAEMVEEENSRLRERLRALGIDPDTLD